MKIQEIFKLHKAFLENKIKEYKAKNDLLDNLSKVVNILILICGLICLIVAYINFLKLEGYPEKSDILNNLFTKGTASFFYSKPFIITISILFAIKLVLILIHYYINEIKKNKIISTVLIIISILSMGLYFIAYQIIYHYGIDFPQKVLSSHIFRFFINTKTLPTLGIIAFVTCIIYFIFLLRSNTSSLIIKTLVLLFITFCIFPLVILCMENIILGIIALAALIVYALFFMPRCKNCKGIFCLEKGKKEFMSQSTISIMTKTNNYDNNGNVIGTSDTYVPGTRYTYQTEYICKICGKKDYKLSFNEHKNT